VRGARRLPAAAAALALALGAGACARRPLPPAAAPPDRAPPGPLYVAAGASETVGIGAADPLREAWPQVLYRTATGPRTTFVNLGVPGATVAEARRDQVPEAVALRPDVVTVWLNVNDLLAQVPTAAYEAGLVALLGDLRRGGATRVLVANTPPLDRLPAYLGCRSAPADCPLAAELPGPDAVVAAVAAYNQAVARAAAATGAEVVDLHALGLAARARGGDGALVSGDGFHPSTAGHAAVAAAFAEVLGRR